MRSVRLVHAARLQCEIVGMDEARVRCVVPADDATFMTRYDEELSPTSTSRDLEGEDRSVVLLTGYCSLGGMRQH
ncbi:hypothetical protein MRX96_017269 [Rhipicephalus microplus]